jgi:hypothetical protein
MEPVYQSCVSRVAMATAASGLAIPSAAERIFSSSSGAESKSLTAARN